MILVHGLNDFLDLFLDQIGKVFPVVAQNPDSENTLCQVVVVQALDNCFQVCLFPAVVKRFPSAIDWIGSSVLLMCIAFALIISFPHDPVTADSF